MAMSVLERRRTMRWLRVRTYRWRRQATFLLGGLLTGIVAAGFTKLADLAAIGFQHLDSRWRWAALLVTPAGFALSIHLTTRFFQNAQGSGIPQAMIEQTKASPAWSSLLALAPTLAYDVRLLNEGVVPADRLTAIACPVLGTSGSLSAPWAEASVRAVAEAVQNGEWRVLEGQAHNVAPDVLAAVLRERFS